MKKMIYLIVLLIYLPVQATLGDAVDFVAKATQEYSKKEPEQRKKLVAIKKNMHPAKKLGWEFINGFSKTVMPASGYLGYRIGIRLYENKSLDPAKLTKMHPLITLLSMGICLGDIIDVFCLLNKNDTRCSHCDSGSSGIGLKKIVRIAGSVTAVTLLFMLTSAKE